MTYTYTYRHDAIRRDGFRNGLYLPGSYWPVVYICSTVCVNIMHKSYLECLIVKFAITSFPASYQFSLGLSCPRYTHTYSPVVCEER